MDQVLTYIIAVMPCGLCNDYAIKRIIHFYVNMAPLFSQIRIAKISQAW
jgi:hypothetical protein